MGIDYNISFAGLGFCYATIHFHLSIGGEDDLVAFDGVALPSYYSDIWKKVVPESADNGKIKSQEKEKGLKTMFPTW